MLLQFMLMCLFLKLQTKVSADLQSSSTADEEREAEALRDPGRDLFLWAILQNDKELAEIAWEQVAKREG